MLLWWRRFLGQNGWYLLHTWLTDAYESRNTALLTELLELLTLCPPPGVSAKDEASLGQLVRQLAHGHQDLSISSTSTFFRYIFR